MRYALYALFMLSGFAGLIYESIWTHYLKLFLGHAAYAQTLVLVIFMGGMAFGAWLAGEMSRRIARPLVAYAVVELALAFAAFAFDALFRGLQDWAYDSAIPALHSTVAIDALRWSLSALVILPQCTLLGMTFPLMSAAVVRIASHEAGNVLGWLYFTNSFGAAVGVLVSGFLLIEKVGLPGTIMTAGLVNVVLVLALWLLIRRAPAPPVPDAADADARGLPRLLLAASFFTGAASFFYEIGWIRMLSLVLGAATHSFELMLSAFILGLALGSFAIRRRIGGIAEPLKALAWIQVVMGLLALMTLPLYNESFDWMATLLHVLQRSVEGYVAFNIASHAICVALMLPVTICAGMTLPLITATLLRSGYGERAIGRVYAANTVGAIVGVLIAVHVVMPYLGLRHVVIDGALVDIGLGAVLFARAGGVTGRWARVGLAACALVAAAVIVGVRFDPARLSSGVYRHGLPLNSSDVVFYRDGKTASVAVTENRQQVVSILSNGKVDAGLSRIESSQDDYTMLLSGALPVLLRPGLKEAAVIGIGSGRSTHVLLQNPGVERVDTIEIEPAMVEGARRFGDLVKSTFADPRSEIHFEDAKTFFARTQRQYDAILSEPSNPWVSGVASLFSQEFYHRVKRNLRPGGILVQWLQLYEISPPLVSSVFRALGSEFADYDVFASTENNILIVAYTGPREAGTTRNAFADLGPRMTDLLATVHVRGPQDIAARWIGDRATLDPFFRSYGVPPNSDYFPFLDPRVVESRFLRESSSELVTLGALSARLRGRATDAPALAPAEYFSVIADAVEGQRLYATWEWMRHPRQRPAVETDEEALAQAGAIIALKSECGQPLPSLLSLPKFEAMVERYGDTLTREQGQALAADLRQGSCAAREDLQRWVDLLEGVAAGDPGATRKAAERIIGKLPAGAPIPEWPALQLLLADLRSNEPRKVLERLSEWGARVPRTVPLRLLSSVAIARLQEHAGVAGVR